MIRQTGGLPMILPEGGWDGFLCTRYSPLFTGMYIILLAKKKKLIVLYPVQPAILPAYNPHIYSK
jgi:hypothetical protein